MRVLVGNKSDDVGKRVVKKEQAEEFARKNGMIYFETSAKSGENVENMFTNLTRKIKSQIVDHNQELSKKIKI